jgi:hypothetical protein
MQHDRAGGSIQILVGSAGQPLRTGRQVDLARLNIRRPTNLPAVVENRESCQAHNLKIGRSTRPAATNHFRACDSKRVCIASQLCAGS